MRLRIISALARYGRFLAMVAAFAWVTGPSLSAAETKMYLELKGIAGDVTDTGFEGQIEILSYSGGPTIAEIGSGSGEAGEMSLTKYIDSSSPELLSLVLSGDHLKEATLRVVRTISGDFDSMMIIEMRDVLITGVQSASETETITLGFKRSKVTGTLNTDPVTKMYLEIKGVSGDVTDPGFEGQIEVLSYSGISGSGSGGAGELSLIKYVDSSSALLFSLSNSGTYLKIVTLRVVQSVSGAIESITTIDLRDVLVTGVQSGSGTNPTTEAITFDFARSKVSH